MKQILFFLLLITASAIQAQSSREVRDSLLYKILSVGDPLIDEVLQHANQYEFQLIYTRINKENKLVSFEERSLFKDSFHFYPASLIKFPLAVVALEYLYSLKESSIGLHTKMQLSTCSCDKPSNSYIKNSLYPTPEQLLREMMIMSNNDAYNVFFNLVGTDRCNSRLKEMGLHNIILRRRFTSGCSDDNNRRNGGFSFTNEKGSLLFSKDCDSSVLFFMPDSSLPVKAGRSYYENGKKITGKYDYSNSNFVRLADAHDLMIRIFYPESNSDPAAAFRFDSIYRTTLISALGGFPRELLHAKKNYSSTPDYYYKFFADPESINTKKGTFRIYNKVGLAAGFISDVSYFEDKENNVSFFLSAAIFAKRDGIINGGSNNYYDLGIPLLRKIGKLIYRYELEQTKKQTVEH